MSQFQYFSEQFADIRILRFQVPGFELLPLNQKIQLYYLQQAAHWGRDIIYDQNFKYNLPIRKTLEFIYLNTTADRNSDYFKAFEVFLKRIWFSNGIHHHNSMDKIAPSFSLEYWNQLINQTTDFKQFSNSLKEIEMEKLTSILFNPELFAKRVVLDDGVDLVKNSANNFYENISQKEAEDFYQALSAQNISEPPSYGLNSKLIKENGIIKELVWKLGGMYSQEIEKMIYWLEKARDLSEKPIQYQAFDKLIEFYRTGNLTAFDQYSILWLQDIDSTVDAVHGFIEVYGDPLGKKATYESVVSIRDEVASLRAKTISDNAQWFENHSTTDKAFKKEKVEGVSAKAIHAVVEAGDCSPSTPIGINLPNADWIREKFGSKSVSISNIMQAYDEAGKDSGALQEFAFSEREVELSKKWSASASSLHVDLHEIVGHGSGKLLNGVADPSETLKSYASTLEEARADLVALYFALDPKLEELGLQDSIEVGYAEYNSYIRSGLMTQLVRVELGKNIEESHMRNRQLIASWAYEMGKSENIIERKIKEEKTYFVVNDHQKLRRLFGKLLAEVQRIKSTGDYEAGKLLVETYGVKVDYELHQEVLERWKKLNIAPYSGFLNPHLTPVVIDDKMVDISIDYPTDFAKQMLFYSQHYALY